MTQEYVNAAESVDTDLFRTSSVTWPAGSPS